MRNQRAAQPRSPLHVPGFAQRTACRGGPVCSSPSPAAPAPQTPTGTALGWRARRRRWATTSSASRASRGRWAGGALCRCAERAARTLGQAGTLRRRHPVPSRHPAPGSRRLARPPHGPHSPRRPPAVHTHTHAAPPRPCCERCCSTRQAKIWACKASQTLDDNEPDTLVGSAIVECLELCRQVGGCGCGRSTHTSPTPPEGHPGFWGGNGARRVGRERGGAGGRQGGRGSSRAAVACRNPLASSCGLLFVLSRPAASLSCASRRPTAAAAHSCASPCSPPPPPASSADGWRARHRGSVWERLL